MSSFTDKLIQTKKIAEWKVNQQFRMNQKKTEINGVTSRQRTQISEIGKKAIELADAENITNDELLELINKYHEQGDHLLNLEAELKEISDEIAPSFDEDISFGGIPQDKEKPQKMICPECGEPLNSEFCRVHGKRGIPADQS